MKVFYLHSDAKFYITVYDCMILSNIMYTYPTKPAWKSCVVSYCCNWFSSWLDIVYVIKTITEFTVLNLRSYGIHCPVFNHCTILPINIGTRPLHFFKFDSFLSLKFRAPSPFLCLSIELFTFLSTWLYHLHRKQRKYRTIITPLSTILEYFDDYKYWYIFFKIRFCW